MGRRTRGILLILLGLALTFCGAGLYAKYDHQAQEAGYQAKVLLQEVEAEIEQYQLIPMRLEAPEGQMVQAAVDGRGVIGILQIEEAGIRLPVLYEWSYEQLDFGPCRYSGSLEEENLVLMGHNYADHLARLDQVEPGDPVEFEDVLGTIHRYQVAATAVIQPTETEKVADPSYPLTIFTCTPGGQKRYVVYCAYAPTETK